MTSKPTDLASIAAAKTKLAEELRKLEKQEAELREQYAIKAFDQVKGLLKDFGRHFSARQKAEIAGFFASEVGTKVPSKKPTSSRQEVQPKYWLPHSGETWTGRGRPPRAFTTWEGTVAYREWKVSHPDEKFPKFPG